METPAYIRVGRVLLYTVHHAPEAARRAGVLMLGPFGLERTHAYLAWVRVARSLARAGFDVLRLDYRGTGESSGDFESATFDAWVEDAERGFDALAERRLRAIGLLGLRAGALVAARVFQRRGDALVLWEPPASGRAHLLEILRRKLAGDYAEGARAGGRTREDYVRELEAGSVVEVEGYPWTKRFWESAAQIDRPATDPRRTRTVFTQGTAHGDSVVVDVPRPPFWLDSMVLDPDISGLVADSVDWLDRMLAADSHP